MRIVEPSFNIEWAPPPEALLEHLERCARTCYRSEGKIGAGTADRLIRRVLGAVLYPERDPVAINPIP